VDTCTCLVVSKLIVYLKAKLTMQATHFASLTLRSGLRKKGREYARLADQMFLRGMHTSSEMARMRLAGHAVFREGILDTEFVRCI
jgi:hypothetical protein